MFYFSEAGALQVFLKDKLALDVNDIAEGWLILKVPEAKVSVQPNHGTEQKSGAGNTSFYCEDVVVTVSKLKSRDVVFTQEIQDQGYGLVTSFKAPGDLLIQLLNPKYAEAS